MRLIIISTEKIFEKEAEAITSLFEEGLQILHLRKPDSSLADYENLIQKIPAKYHNRIVLHEYFHLVEKYDLRGMHLNRRNSQVEVETRHATSLQNRKITISKSCHSLEELKNIENYDYVFLSPIFDSISKTGYQSTFSAEVLQKASDEGLINEKVFALGGINFENTKGLEKYGFGGVAMLGAVWNDKPNRFLKPVRFDKAFDENFAFQFITHKIEKYDYLQSAELALTGGCRWIQLRMKDTPLPEVEKNAIILREMCKKANATFIIDDHVEIAKKIGANGVHLGKTDMHPTKAREILGNNFIIGGTANTFEDIANLHKAGVNYIGLGPFRFTETKKNLSDILGLEGYEKIIKQCQSENIYLPIVAIGGIKTADIQSIMNTGVSGIAVSGNILRAENPVEETKEIIKSIKFAKNMNLDKIEIAVGSTPEDLKNRKIQYCITAIENDH